VTTTNDDQKKEAINQRTSELLQAFTEGKLILHLPTKRTVVDLQYHPYNVKEIFATLQGEESLGLRPLPTLEFGVSYGKRPYKARSAATPTTSSAPFRKADAGKPRPTLLPAKALQSVIEVLEFGAEEYGRDNWRIVDDPNRFLDAALRHLLAVRIGGLKVIDKKSGLPHIDHAACNLLFLSEIVREDYDAEVARAKAKLTSTMTDKKQ